MEKSIEGYILALETINRLSIKYRVETFCYLICTAWELLLKAKILDDCDNDHNAIYRGKKKRGECRESLSICECLDRIIPNKSDPERRNIECIKELRDEAVHLVISQIPRDVLCLFQAGVINYHKRLNEWFGVSLSDRVPVGMMSIVYDMRPEQGDLTDKRMRRELGKDALAFLSRYCLRLKQEFNDLQRSAQFSIPIEYRLVLTKKHDNADIMLSAGSIDGDPTGILEVPKDPSTSHPFRQTEVIEQMNMAVEGLKINSHDIQCVNIVYNVRKKPEYYYKGKVIGSPTQYSPAFVSWLLKQFRKNPQFFQETRMRAKGKG